jgi:hypothetical protein
MRTPSSKGPAPETGIPPGCVGYSSDGCLVGGKIDDVVLAQARESRTSR